MSDWENLLGLDLVPWISNAPDGKAFSVANALQNNLRKDGISNKSVDALAVFAVHGVIDGAYTDNTALANAIAGGADEVVVVMNSDSKDNPVDLQLLFAGGFVNPFIPTMMYPIFKEPTAKTLREKFALFHKLRLPWGTQFLKILQVGSFEATTEVNTYFDIAGDKKVTIHVVSVGSDLTIGFLEDFSQYNILAQEVAMTILDDANSDFVANTLLPLFEGSRYCTDHPGCADLKPEGGLCCPVADGVRLACCDQASALSNMTHDKRWSSESEFSSGIKYEPKAGNPLPMLV